MSDWIENQNVIGGSTSKSVRVELVNTDGTPKTDADYTDVTAYFYRPGDATITSITMATLAAIDSAYSSGGFKHISNGVCRFDPPNASIAAITGGGKVLFTMSVSGCFPCNFELTIVSENASTVKAAVAALSIPSAATNASAVRTELTTELGRIDASVSSRSTYAGADTSGTTTLLSRLTSTRAGLLDFLDATISSRLASSGYTAPDNASLTTLVGRLTSARATLLDNLSLLDAAISDLPDELRLNLATELARIDAAISSRNATTPPTVAAIRSEMDSNSTKLANLDTTISSRAAAATALSSATWTSTKAGYLDAAISSISGGGGGGSVSGAYTVTLTVTDGTSPLQSARVRVGEGVTFETYVTDASGQVQISRDAGTYRVAITKDGYSFDPVERTITGDDAGTITEDFVMTQVALPSPPDDPSLCRVAGYAQDITDQPVANVAITFTLMSPDPISADRMIAGRKKTARTDSNGQLTFNDQPYIDLERNDLLSASGTQYRVTSGALKLNKLVTLESSSFDLKTLFS